MACTVGPLVVTLWVAVVLACTLSFALDRKSVV